MDLGLEDFDVLANSSSCCADEIKVALAEMGFNPELRSRELLEMADRDGDHQIDFDEFVDAMLKQPPLPAGKAEAADAAAADAAADAAGPDGERNAPAAAAHAVVAAAAAPGSVRSAMAAAGVDVAAAAAPGSARNATAAAEAGAEAAAAGGRNVTTAVANGGVAAVAASGRKPGEGVSRVVGYGSRSLHENGGRVPVPIPGLEWLSKGRVRKWWKGLWVAEGSEGSPEGSRMAGHGQSRRHGRESEA